MKTLKFFLTIFSFCVLMLQTNFSFSTTINITVGGLEFTPPSVNAAVGDTIRWQWLNGIHTTTCDGSDFTSLPENAAPWDEPMTSVQQTFAYVLTVPGRYDYKCTFHAPFMVGTINASEPSLSLNLTALIQGFWNGSSTVEDTVKVSLHNSVSPFAKIDSAKGKLNTAGIGVMNFTQSAGGSYYIVVTHRNSIETWSKLPITFPSGGNVVYNFTTAASTAFGDNLILKIGKFCIYGGDTNQDDAVELSDVVAIFNDANNFVTGYVVTDVTGDNFVDLSDLSLAFNNASNFVTVIRP